MAPDPPTNVPAWRILRVEDTTAVVGVTPMAVKRVWLRLFDGSETYVDVPRDSYNAQHVAMLANRLAEAHFEVVNQQGPELQLGQ